MENLTLSKYITENDQIPDGRNAPSVAAYNETYKQYCIGDELGRIHIFDSTNSESFKTIIATEVIFYYYFLL